ncbi:MAG: hypothetical protein L6Q54_04190 [Leptospiraceae bacterium]|nr:hypothetical protein [Leptospiraceae bacterium]MCK6380435.1 hypothetical protein [Leptospiraceae bacterium]NUM40689.1 hypothetical protein [Leptospiraceae bacterium]
MLYGTRTTEAHPGEDYNCRCWAEPAFGDEPDTKPWKDEWTATGSEQSLSAGASDVFNNQATGSFKSSIKDIFSSIDSAHGFKKNIDVVPINEYRDYSGTGGTLGYHPLTKNPVFIEINKHPVHKDFLELNTAHEIGHFVDLEVLGNKGSFYSETPFMSEFFLAIEETNPVQKLREALRTGLFRNDLLRQDRRNHIRYLLNKQELWARAYSQYIGTKSKNKKILDGVKKH